MPSIELRAPITVGPRDWGQELLLAHTEFYTAKLLLMKAGAAGGLQVHRQKVETFFVDEGQVFVDYDTGDGRLTRLTASPGMSVHIPAGAVHRVTAITAAKLFEVSTPHFDDRVRCEAQYGEPEVGGLPTTSR